VKAIDMPSGDTDGAPNASPPAVIIVSARVAKSKPTRLLLESRSDM
jgi:hypothetical protein